MGVRRVVTGQDDTGRSIIVSDELLATEPGAGDFHALWGADDPPRFPQDGVRPRQSAAMFPGPGGYRFFVWTIDPGRDGSMTAEELAALPPDIREHLEEDAPGMHASDTVDLEIILTGEVGLELDDGAIVWLKAGDYLVQNGTRHRWLNRGDVPATVAGVVIGGYKRVGH